MQHLSRSTRSSWFYGIILFGLCLAPFLWLIFSTPGFVGNDDYYHARISALIIEQKQLPLDFPWLPYTILSPEEFVDHHLLFHLVLAPFAHWGGLTGAKLATAGIAAGIGIAAWILLRGVGVRYPALWTLALFGLSAPFLYRLLMIRTQGASLLLLIVTLHLLFQRQYRWLLLMGFVYTWLYDGFVLLLIVAGLYLVGQWIAERAIMWQPLVYSVIGIGLGLIINPYFPNNLEFILDHLGAKTDFETGTRVGTEWYPYTTAALLTNSKGAILALVVGILWPSFSNRRADGIVTTLLLVSLVTLYMVFRSRRFIEYYPAFALLYCAVSWGRGGVSFKPLSRNFVLLGAGSLAVLLLGTTLYETRRTIQDARDVNYLAGASNWLEKNTAPGTLVFQTDWDDFPYLFYHNTHNTYLVGLDPTYLERADAALWDQWVSITQGEVHHPSEIIASKFGVEYIISDTRHYAFAQQVRDDPGIEMVYRDEYGFVWKVTSTSPTTACCQ